MGPKVGCAEGGRGSKSHGNLPGKPRRCQKLGSKLLLDGGHAVKTHLLPWQPRTEGSHRR